MTTQRERINNFCAAMEVWADKTADQYVEYGLPEGETPQSWCTDVLLDSLTDDGGCMDALFELVQAEFLRACARRGHK